MKKETFPVVGNYRHSTQGRADISFKIKKQKYTFEFDLVDGEKELTLGRDFMEAYEVFLQSRVSVIRLNVPKNKWILNDDDYKRLVSFKPEDGAHFEYPG